MLFIVRFREKTTKEFTTGGKCINKFLDNKEVV